MQKLLLPLLVLPLLTGCWQYGDGQAIEYPYAIEDGIFWTKVWAKTDLTSSESDCFVLNDFSLEQHLRDAIEKKQKVRLNYDRHFFAAAKGCLYDKITSIDIL